jgi:hypothetical protein
LGPREACLSQEGAQRERLQPTAHSVLALERSQAVPLVQERVPRVPKGDRRRSIHDANYSARLQHPPHLLEGRDRLTQVLEDRARESSVE